MNILIITTWFPPDTTIAAVRPYMFAKYLRKAGHDVTVLRSGAIHIKIDGNAYPELDIKVCSYMGENSEAERYRRGEPIQAPSVRKRRAAFLPDRIRKALIWVYECINGSFDIFRRLQEAKNRFKLQKAWIDENRNQNYDVVFSTCGELENIYAGKYAAEVFGCKWILDFRDPIAQKLWDNLWEYPIMKRIQKKAILSADVCTAVSVGLAEEISNGTDKDIITLYNGFDTVAREATPTPEDGILRFCYTGIMYKYRSPSSLFCAIKQLADTGKLDLKNIRFEYAGPDFDMILAQAKPYGVEEILIDHGYVSRTEAYEIQCRSDIFLVLSWNTKLEQGVLTGKFYEGIRAKKPILSLLTGDKPDSDLNLLNKKYNYGFCYETCQEKVHFPALLDWLETAYTCKQAGQPIPYHPEPGLFTDFCYSNLSQKLEKIMLEMTQE